MHDRFPLLSSYFLGIVAACDGNSSSFLSSMYSDPERLHCLQQRGEDGWAQLPVTISPWSHEQMTMAESSNKK